MTIDKAIEILHLDLGADTYDAYPGLYAAQKLGIEALKQIKECRPCSECERIALLPGETEE